MASMAAWQATSPSECAAGPAIDGIAMPPTCNGRSSTRRCRSYPVPTRPVASARRRAADEILFCRDLHVSRFSCHDVHRMTGALGERRLVGGFDAGSPERDSRGEHFAAEALRRLGEKDLVPRDRFDDERAVRMALDPLDRVARFDRGDGRAVRGRSLDRAIDHRGADERSRGVVNQHDLGRRIDAREGVRHRILAAGAAGHDRQRPHGRADVGLSLARVRAPSGTTTTRSETPGCESNARTLRERMLRHPDREAVSADGSPSGVRRRRRR